MGLLDGLQPVVQTLMNTFGTTATYQPSQEGSGFDATDGIANKASPLNRTVKVVIAEYQKHELVGNVQAGDRKVLMAADDGLEPKSGDHIKVDGKQWRVMGVAVTRGTDDGLLWELQVRR